MVEDFVVGDDFVILLSIFTYVPDTYPFISLA